MVFTRLAGWPHFLLKNQSPWLAACFLLAARGFFHVAAGALVTRFWFVVRK